MRQRVSRRLHPSTNNKVTLKEAPTTAKGGGKSTSTIRKRAAAKKLKSAGLAVAACIAFTKDKKGDAREKGGEGGEFEGHEPKDNDLGERRGELSGLDLLDVCDQLENDNLRLRNRLAKLELQTMQREHGAEDGQLDDESLLMPVQTFMIDDFLASPIPLILIYGLVVQPDLCYSLICPALQPAPEAWEGAFLTFLQNASFPSLFLVLSWFCYRLSGADFRVHRRKSEYRVRQQCKLTLILIAKKAWAYE